MPTKVGKLTAVEKRSPNPLAQDLTRDEEVDGIDVDVDYPYELFPRSDKYSPNTYIQAAAYYVVLGNSVKTHKYTGIPARTIRQWTTQDWWKTLVKEVRKHKQDELDAKLTSIIMGSTDRIEDRLANGDTKVVNGEQVKIPLQAMEIAKIIGIMYDKRALLRGDPTSRTETSKDSNAILLELQQRFASMVRDTKQINVVETVQYEPKEVN